MAHGGEVVVHGFVRGDVGEGEEDDGEVMAARRRGKSGKEREGCTGGDLSQERGFGGRWWCCSPWRQQAAERCRW